MVGEKSRPPKPLQKIPVSSQAHRALNCLPKADKLFIVTELACESSKNVSHTASSAAKAAPKCALPKTFKEWAESDATGYLRSTEVEAGIGARVGSKGILNGMSFSEMFDIRTPYM